MSKQIYADGDDDKAWL